MVKFHQLNRLHTAGVILFIISMVIIVAGIYFHSVGQMHLFALSFFYGIGLFLLSALILLIGTLLAARSGKLQNRFNEILNNSNKK